MKSLWSGSLLCLLVACGGGGNEPEPRNPANPDKSLGGQLSDKIMVAFDEMQPLQKTGVAPLSGQERQQVDAILRETNRLRAAQNLPPLILDEDLNAYAKVRAGEAALKFRHERPNGVMAIDDPYFYGAGDSGENMAASSHRSGAGIVQLWQRSPSHYQNIVGRQFQRIGIGYYYDSQRQAGYWVQLFAGGRRQSQYKFHDQAKAQVDLRDLQQQAGSHFKNQGSRAARLPLRHGYVLEMADGRRLGLQHQNLGTVVDGRHVLGYVNVGQRFIPDANTHFVADYRGQALANHGTKRLTAEVTARVDFRQNKHMVLQVQHANPQWRFSERLAYDASRGVFQGRPGNQAMFFGAEAAELGGRFSRDVAGEKYQGAYGLSRQQ